LKKKIDFLIWGRKGRKIGGGEIGGYVTFSLRKNGLSE